MKTFILKLFAFACINVLVFLAWYGWLFFKESPCPIDESVSCVHMMSGQQHYDVLVLGTSHGKSLSVNGNQKRVERILGKTMINLSKTGGAGPLWAKIYLSLFYDNQNEVDTIVYFIDPWVFASSDWNEDLCAVLMHEEPFRFRLFARALVNRVSPKCLVLYVRAYLLQDWDFNQCDTRGADDHYLTGVDEFAINERIGVLYPGDGPREIKDSYWEDLSRVVNTGRRHGARTILILPPTLLGDIELMNELKNKLAVFTQRNGIQWYDYSRAITDPALYTDHDHLNSLGIEVFVGQYVKPILNR